MVSSCADKITLPVDFLDRIEVLFEQESAHYRTVDYLGNAEFETNQNEHFCSHSPSSVVAVVAPSGPFGNSKSSSKESLSYIWREKMCEWAYQLVDHFDFSREIVSIGMNYLDRYLSAGCENISKRSFQLLAMTCLYLAIKLNQPLHLSKTLSMEYMIHLSRGFFTEEQMQAMELHVFQRLDWRLHPTTPLVFLRHYLEMLQIDRKVHHQLLDLGRFFIELSVLDYFFVSRRSSTIAMAALLNALERLPSCCCQDADCVMEFLVTETRLQHEQVIDCRERLCHLYLPNAATTLVHPADDDQMSTPGRHNKIRKTTSPISLAQNVQDLQKLQIIASRVATQSVVTTVTSATSRAK